jgi:hypothetical protein
MLCTSLQDNMDAPSCSTGGDGRSTRGGSGGAGIRTCGGTRCRPTRFAGGLECGEGSCLRPRIFLQRCNAANYLGETNPVRQETNVPVAKAWIMQRIQCCTAH